MATTSRRRKAAPASENTPSPATNAPAVTAEPSTVAATSAADAALPAAIDAAGTPAPARPRRSRTPAAPRRTAKASAPTPLSPSPEVASEAPAPAAENVVPASKPRRRKAAPTEAAAPVDLAPPQPDTAPRRPRRRKPAAPAPAVAAAAEAAAAAVLAATASVDPQAGEVPPPMVTRPDEGLEAASTLEGDVCSTAPTATPAQADAEVSAAPDAMAPEASTPAAAVGDDADEVTAAIADDASSATALDDEATPARRKRRRRGRNKSETAAAPTDDAATASANPAAAPAAEVPTAMDPAASAEAPAEDTPTLADEATAAPAPALIGNVESNAIPAATPTPEPIDSHLSLMDDGLQCQIRWQAGSRCPDTLRRAVSRWSLAEDPAALGLSAVDDLSELHALAARTGHRLTVDDAVWAHLARLGDLQARIAHLEAQHPQGLDPAAQTPGHWLAGWRACQLEAAFYAAAVGRCVLADDPALQPQAELLLAARLVMQHFGAAPPVLLAPADSHPEWQAAWRRLWEGPAAPAGESAPADTDVPALTLLTPDRPVPTGTEVLLLDQRQGLDATVAAQAAARASTWLWVWAPAEALACAEALPLLKAVDTLRQGAVAEWQRSGDVAALAPLVLARRFADVAEQWPAWAPEVRVTAARADEQEARHALGQRLARWQRSGFLADSDQLAVRRAIQSLWDRARDANSDALPGLLRQALEGGVQRVVVFGEDVAVLETLADALRTAGLPAQALPGAGAPRLAEQALRTYREAADAQILLVADGQDGAEPRIGVQLGRPLVVHLDTPWSGAALARRLQRVRPARHQREVPVWQLLPEGSTMAHRAQALALASDAADATPQPHVTPAPTGLSGALLRGDALNAWLQEIQALWATQVVTAEPDPAVSPAV